MRVVEVSQVQEVCELLSKEVILSLDTETTGLRAYNGDRPFSVIIASRYEEYYFNFNPGTPHYIEGFELRLCIQSMVLSNPSISWYLANAPFDMAMLKHLDLEIAGRIHDIIAIGRVEYNDHFQYGLAAQGERYGFPKDDAVEEYITEHDLWEWMDVPGKKIRHKRKYYDRVPFDIITRYACRDARITFDIGEKQFEKISEDTIDNFSRKNSFHILKNEMELTKTVYAMEDTGVMIDGEFCERASGYERDRGEELHRTFLDETGKELINSGKLFAEIFWSEKHKWQYTKKGNPSFTGKVIENFDHPMAKIVTEWRDAKSKSDFYNGFLYHADAAGVVHPHWNQGGAAPGRFSSSDPNFQNLKKDSDTSQEFVVRRAVIPRPGNVFVMCDYDQMEYRLMLDYACGMAGYESKLVKEVKGGKDVHEATASLAGITRDQAKTTNFLTLYGGGNGALALGLGVSVQEAKRIRSSIFRAAPELKILIDNVSGTAERRGYIFNWAGRKCHFKNRDFSYKAPNHLIQGGCADITKIAMNELHTWLKMSHRGWLVLTIHDELVVECPACYREEVAAKMKEIMEGVYPHRFIPLTAGVEWSSRSLADKEKFAA